MDRVVPTNLSVYEEMKERMEHRVNAVIEYATTSTTCREKMLLRYFEEKGGDCGHCDVCIDRRKREGHTMEDVHQGVLYMAQVKPRRLKDFMETLSFPGDEVLASVSFLVDEGLLLHLDDDTYKNPIPLD